MAVYHSKMSATMAGPSSGRVHGNPGRVCKKRHSDSQVSY